MPSNLVVLDVATAVLPEAAKWIVDEDIDVPANYKDSIKIAQYKDMKRQDRYDKAALDPDCCCISGIGILVDGEIELATGWNTTEIDILAPIVDRIRAGDTFITFNGLKFDLPVIQRRAMYLGFKDVDLKLDRYRCPHIDLFDRLTYKGLTSAHSLTWYRRRFDWTDIETKLLTGHEESQIFVTQEWKKLEASLTHDLLVTARLAMQLHILPMTPEAERHTEPVF